MKKRILLFLATSVFATMINAKTISNEIKQIEKETEKINKEIAKLQQDEKIISKKTKKEEQKLNAYNKKKNLKTTSTYKKNRIHKKRKISKKKYYSKKHFKSNKKITQHINYKRPNYIVRDYYPTFSKDLKKDYDMQIKREKKLKDTL